MTRCGHRIGGLLMALTASGCSALAPTLTPCRIAAVGVGGVIGGVGGGLGLAAADLPASDRAGALTAGTIGFVVVGAALGAVVGALACPPPTSAPPPPADRTLPPPAATDAPPPAGP